ncbi:hypothetical protein YYG_01143 [Plasmodium vinckei petteri]|uniref:PIR protein CIR protein n=1 Tax=Plasmodium vinckei petteri TaxID=138298 RepID=W7AKS6_PLAVN|nr:hypothetical protein YYG_01143 [Plasmodium vinckei petteri]
MMWLGDKLFKIENGYKIILEESYKNHLDKHPGTFKYWDALNSKNIYKEATTRRLSEFYKLLNNISLTTIKREDKYFLLDSEELSFNNEECGKVKSQDEQIGRIIASKDSKSKSQWHAKSNKPNNLALHNASNPGKGVSQTVASTKGALPRSGISPSNIGNGNKTLGTAIKVSKKPSIWCITPNKKCGIIGIGIIGISIFIVLTIMYKYLPFGSAKNSKKEKNMKRVINLVDDKKKAKIIINSEYKKKYSK